MNIEKMHKFLGVNSSEPELTSLFGSFFMPLLLLMTDQYGIEDIIYDKSEEDYRVNIRLGMINESFTRFFYNQTVTDLFHEFCKQYYDKDIEEIVNGPAKVFIGFGKNIIDLVNVELSSEEAKSIDCIISEYNESIDDFESKLVNIESKILQISISVPKSEMIKVRDLNDNKIFDYLAFLLYNWLVVSTTNHYWDLYNIRINKIISHLNKEDVREGKNESVKNDIQETKEASTES